jgi:hypothetical protein
VKVFGGLLVTLGAVIGSFLFGLLLRLIHGQGDTFKIVSESVQFWNVWVMLPLGVIVAALFLVAGRAGTNKRVCRECGKKWKVRGRGHEGEEKETVPASGQTS